MSRPAPPDTPDPADPAHPVDAGQAGHDPVADPRYPRIRGYDPTRDDPLWPPDDTEACCLSGGA